jgi:hypothetical protein
MNPAGPAPQIEPSGRRTSASVALVRAILSVLVCGGAFVAFLIAPLTLVVFVCGGMWWAEWIRVKRKRTARRVASANAGGSAAAPQSRAPAGGHVGFGGQSGRDQEQL